MQQLVSHCPSHTFLQERGCSSSCLGSTTAANTSFHVPSPVCRTIKVVHRAAGSSSTSALTNYLREASVADGCPVQWPANEVGSTVSPNTWAQERIEVPNSQKMVDTLESTDFTIGYVESNQGIKNGERRARECSVCQAITDTCASAIPFLLL